MSIIDELQPYLDNIGMVQDHVQPHLSGNGPAYSAETALTLAQNGFNLTWPIPWVKDTEVEPGLFVRHSDPRGFRDSPNYLDNYLGLAYWSVRFDNPGIAQRILAYGRSHFWKFGPFRFKYFYFNGTETDTQNVASWLGRFPALIYCLQSAAGETPSLWRKVWFHISLATTNVKDTNQARLARLMAAFHPNSLATRIYHDNMRSAWAPGGTTEEAMQKCYASYWGPDHPTGRYARG